MDLDYQMRRLAQGTFFRQDSGNVYMGDSVLMFAAIAGKFELVKYLVNQVSGLS